MKLLLNKKIILLMLLNLSLLSFHAYADNDAPIFSTTSPATTSSSPELPPAQPAQPTSPALTGERETVIKENLTHLGPEGGLGVDKLPPAFSTDKANPN